MDDVDYVRTRFPTRGCRPQRRGNNLYVFFEPNRAPARFARRWIRQPRGDLDVIVTVIVPAEQNIFIGAIEERLVCLIWPARLFCRSWYHNMNLVFEAVDKSVSRRRDLKLKRKSRASSRGPHRPGLRVIGNAENTLFEPPSPSLRIQGRRNSSTSCRTLPWTPTIPYLARFNVFSPTGYLRPNYPSPACNGNHTSHMNTAETKEGYMNHSSAPLSIPLRVPGFSHDLVDPEACYGKHLDHLR